MRGQSADAGRRGQRWERLKAEVRARREPCCICGQPVNYALKWPNRGSFTVQHLKSWADHPELREDPANLRAAHLGCNAGRRPGRHARTREDIGEMVTQRFLGEVRGLTPPLAKDLSPEAEIPTPHRARGPRDGGGGRLARDSANGGVGRQSAPKTGANRPEIPASKNISDRGSQGVEPHLKLGGAA